MKGKVKEGLRQFFDILVLLIGIVLVICLYEQTRNYRWAAIPMLVVAICVGCAFVRVVLFKVKGDGFLLDSGQVVIRDYGLDQLVLLDGQGRPVKSWDMRGRVSLIIGKAGQGQELDIDLSDCEYSGFIDFQHAVLNFCQDQWYIEDLESQNGVRVKKIEDGECYKVIYRPCRVAAGDILYIANTKLLLT